MFKTFIKRIFILGKPSDTMKGKSNPNTCDLIRELRKASSVNKAPVWKYVAVIMENAGSRWAEVNVGKLNRYASEGEIVVVPGKLLGAGQIEKKLTVAAFRFSGQAREKIEKAGGKNVSIEELVKENPAGAKVRIMR